MVARGECGRRALSPDLPGARVAREFLPGHGADEAGMRTAAVFIPLHVVIGAGAPKPLREAAVDFYGRKGTDPADIPTLTSHDLLGEEHSDLYDRCPLAVASPNCPAPLPAPWLDAAQRAVGLVGCDLGAWLPARASVTSAVESAALSLRVAREAAAAWRAEKEEAGW